MNNNITNGQEAFVSHQWGQQPLPTLAIKYNLPLDFVIHLWEITTDKQNFEEGLRMFLAGTLWMDDATGDKPICIEDIKRRVLDNLIRACARTRNK